jgi:hypothetical protein
MAAGGLKNEEEREMGEKEYPKMLYVYHENPGTEDEWYEAKESPHDLADLKEPRRLVGIYELKDMAEIVAEVHLSPGEPI